MKTIEFAFILVLAAAPAAFATRVVGNGGDGLIVDGKVYSLDLVEAGVHRWPYIPRTKIAEEFRGPIRRKFISVGDFPLDKFLQKLSEVKAKAPLFAYLLAAAVVKTNWSVAPILIQPIDDEDSALNYPADKLVQLAVRRHLNVQIDGTHWATMDDENQIALILHELIYMLMPAEQVTLGPQLTGGKQSSFKTRQATGILFKQGWSEQDIRPLLAELMAQPQEQPILRALQESPDAFELRWSGTDRISVLPKGKNRPVLNGPNRVPLKLQKPQALELCLDPSSRQVRSRVKLAPYGAELAVESFEFCHSIAENGDCARQGGLNARAISLSTGTSLKPALLTNLDHVPANPEDPDALEKCAAEIQKRVREISQNPYGKAPGERQ